MVRMSRAEFKRSVEEALDLIPDDLAELIDNVVVLVEDDPPSKDPDLLGLYDGTALTDRGSNWGYADLPDRIYIYMNPTLEVCETKEDVRDEVAVTVIHEIAHHFGIDDERLHELGWD
jgi:predicted Zn-dependent protease with MMP-like domain